MRVFMLAQTRFVLERLVARQALELSLFRVNDQVLLEVLRLGKESAAFLARVSFANGVREDVIAEGVDVVENGLAGVARNLRFAGGFEKATFVEGVALKHILVHKFGDFLRELQCLHGYVGWHDGEGRENRKSRLWILAVRSDEWIVLIAT